MAQKKTKTENLIFHGYKVLLEQKRMKNIYLRVKENGLLHVTAPLFVTKEDVFHFLEERREWITQHVSEKERRAEREAKREYITGETIFLWGEPYNLVVEAYGARSKAIIDKDKLFLTVPQGATLEMRKKALEFFFKKQMEDAVERAFLRWEQVVMKKHNAVTLRNMKSRWGSCNVKTAHITLNLRLVTKSPECLDYVVVHELTHLWVANHGPDFHAKMDQFYPEWRRVRQILNTEIDEDE